jgi:protein-tyrosine-phosphatase
MQKFILPISTSSIGWAALTPVSGRCVYAGVDLTKHHSKSLDEVKAYAPFDAVVTMGCGDACPWMPAKRFVDWQIPDPKNMEREQFNEVKNTIAEKAKNLLKELDVEITAE